ncbi:MAG: HAD family phosphatase [Chloroflexi bacterium]|nr:HAD family phosphatase [Chloroflexota bacterium]
MSAADRYEAVIFDMDGVLVDSEPAFFEAANEVLMPTGKQIDWERYKPLIGASISVTWRSIKEMLQIEGDPEEYVTRYNSTLLEVLAKPRPLLPGVRPALERLRRQGTPIGLATSSRKEWVQALLGGAGLPLDTFDAIAWRQMVAKSKPAPYLYLKAALLLDVPPERCVAVEDTPAGIASANAAGMYSVQVRAASTAFPPIDDADLVLDSLEEFPFELLERARESAT